MDWARAYDAGLTPWDLRGAAEPLRVLAAEGYFQAGEVVLREVRQVLRKGRRRRR